MKTAETGGRAKYYVTAVSTVLPGTAFRNTIRLDIGAFAELEDALDLVKRQSNRKDVKKAKARMQFLVRHLGKTVTRINVERPEAI